MSQGWKFALLHCEQAAVHGSLSFKARMKSLSRSLTQSLAQPNSFPLLEAKQLGKHAHCYKQANDVEVLLTRQERWQILLSHF